MPGLFKPKYTFAMKSTDVVLHGVRCIETKEDLMQTRNSTLSRTVAGIVLGVSMAAASFAQTPVGELEQTVDRIEARLGGRIGIALVDTGSDFTWANRPDEQFLMNSTVKVPLCGALLARVDAGTLSLTDELPVTEGDIVTYAPVTEQHVGQSMNMAALCLAAIDMSDNTAANLLIEHLGGPQAITQFFRSTGDIESRLDRFEPELNTFTPGDPRDTTTPVASADTVRNLLLGDVLSKNSRKQLADWMRHGGVTAKLLRAGAPADWQIYDKSGSGSHTRNLVAMVIPDGRAPWIVSIFISDIDADFETRNAALQDISRAIRAVIGQ
ncbi:class A beta-lactamase [Pseudosulfitobacter pseudonitzschiae]|uniref:class A beta-lactamase n=1 Tax=Pseudosulfitobacter pseudonitzschiae TaxID=1402135 RepID=UPI001CCF9874|nr:class A beta-lactamase [Pseudosulfitobacter pseudonitzschiae]MCD2350831.1 class A beta-lactamase [Pseudosulfitobacter pseudonitzschiae]UFE29223.1 class A beta-lactamase [Pseudosulfitobacter pseudonitzschiae]UFE33861.1 class A beta-lactamase [Pseudosulfitobacter pseudonitzschiae]UFE39447.1 class A beta-lactamase [Pseudosulfitobacter pseudonitzschiae]UFE48254.1 class A beta-lactamase [Pseudosulfitobacter pseudonitzschiae]